MKPFARLLVATAASVALLSGSNAGAQTLSDMELAQFLVKQREQLAKDKELKQKEQEKQKQSDEKKLQEEKAQKEKAEKEAEKQRKEQEKQKEQDKQKEQAGKQRELEKRELEKKEKGEAKSTLEPLPQAAVVLEELAAPADERLYACVGPNDVMHFVAVNEKCQRNQKRISWNAVGPQGASGPQGNPGPQGAPGIPGAPGYNGQNGQNGTTTIEIVQVPGGGSDAQIPIDPIDAPASAIGQITLVGASGQDCPGPDAAYIYGYSADVENTLNISSATTGVGAGKATFGPFSVSKAIDVMSGRLFCLAGMGAHLDVLKVDLFDTVDPKGKGSKAAASYELRLVGVSKLSSARATLSQPPLETVLFEFGAMDIQVGGKSVFCWSKVTNSACH